MSARKGLPQHQINYPVSQSYIYQTPLIHDSPATRTQSSSENLVSQTQDDYNKTSPISVVEITYDFGLSIETGRERPLLLYMSY